MSLQPRRSCYSFFLNNPASTEIYTLSLHDALPILNVSKSKVDKPKGIKYLGFGFYYDTFAKQYKAKPHASSVAKFKADRKSTRLNSSHVRISYAVFCLKKKIIISKA